MRISIFGLGYVGAVTAACFCELGHEVVGVDVAEEKVGEIAAGRTPIAENRLGDLIGSAVSRGLLTATTDAREAVARTDVSLVCVGTPSRRNGSLETAYVERVVSDIGAGLRDKESAHVVVVRSTLLPGTTDARVRPALEAAAGRSVGDRLGLAYNPEFLREGTAVADFHEPPYTVVGADDAAAADAVAEVYAGVDAPVHRVSIPEAEMIKYAANAFHALKITFANEIGHFSKARGVDGHVVMKLITEDTKLNISPAYMRPGFAFGGSCLPKDLRALVHASRHEDLELPLLESVLPSNDRQVQRAVDLILAQGSRRVGILGLSFKEGTDDLRESPIVTVVEALIGKGCELTIFDDNVSWARLVGANRRFIETVIPHIAELLVDSVEEVVASSDVVVIGNAGASFAEALRDAGDTSVVDLVRLSEVEGARGADGAPYHGVCW